MDKARRAARAAERETARRHGGRLTPASGAGDVKNDVLREGWSTEVKNTTAVSYRLHLADLVRAEDHAVLQGRRMAFLVSFSGPPDPRPHRYVLMSEDDFLELTGG